MVTLPSDEKRILIIRKHWFVIAARLLTVAIVFLIPFAVNAVLANNPVPVPEPLAPFFPLSNAWTGLLLSGWTALWWALAFAVWTDYYLDAWIVTDRRIIDIEQRGFFTREISSTRLDRIQDVTTEISGILATFLSFGTIHVQTAGESREFVLPGAPRPDALKERIIALHHEATRDKTDGFFR